MNELQIFTSPEFGEIRTAFQNGEPWFVAKDVCRALDVDDTATRRLDDDEKGLRSIQTLGGTQEMSIISESGLYGLVLGSRKPEAKLFKRWITHEVIPAIRKHGGYLTPEKIEEALSDPDTIIRLATSLKEERAKRKEAERQITADRPKVLFADSVAASNTSILIGELAKILKQNGYDIGQNRLFQWLRDNEYLISKVSTQKNMPTQKSMELGLFEIKERSFSDPSGVIHISKTVKVTGKGQQYFINKFLGKEDGKDGRTADDQTGVPEIKN